MDAEYNMGVFTHDHILSKPTTSKEIGLAIYSMFRASEML